MALSAEKMVTRTRIQLQWRFPWLIEAILRLQPKEAPEWLRVGLMDSANAAAATDGKWLYYHPERFAALSDNDAQFIYLHEIMHFTLKHPWRKKGRGVVVTDEQGQAATLWNVVTDMLINSLIERMGFKHVPGLLYAPTQYRETFAEKLYDILKKECAARDGYSLGGEGKDVDPGAGEITIPLPKDGRYYDDPKITGKLLTPHELWKGAAEAPNDKLDWDSVSVRMQGHMPAGYGLGAELGQRVRIPWYRELGAYVKSYALYDYSRTVYRRIKSPGMCYYLPRLTSPHLKIVVAWDLSGSIDKKQRDRMATESMGVITSFDSYEILMMACDAAVHGYWYLHPGDALPLDELKGGGGTSFIPVFEKVEELDFRPDCLLFFTDSWGTFPAEPPDYPVIWGVVGVDGEVPWGKYLEVILDD